MRRLELLAPARDAGIAMAAIAHGADAVYMGPATHGARSAAANTLDDIRRVVEFAHPYRARVYATVNTIIYDHELAAVERMVWELYRAGVDALIVQDMGLLRLNLPPIQLHASTQCDIRTPEKARFLQNVGFSQLVLARELTLGEIRAITEAVEVPVEVFVHGALCVSYSGRCQASQVCVGRSANRGECAQMCRLPYTLADASGRVLARDKHLLSLRDLNASAMLPELVKAGACSFKIEGRLKDAGYVKNIVAWYRQALDKIIASQPDIYERSSYGESKIAFTPDPTKSFNRGFTHYFMDTRRPQSIISMHTPKSLGEPLDGTANLHNGDGVAWIDRKGVYAGARVSKIDHGRVVTYGSAGIPSGVKLFRTFDHEFQKELDRSNPRRSLYVDITITSTHAFAEDERGVQAAVALDVTMEHGRKDGAKIKSIFAKLGSSIFTLRKFTDTLADDVFIPASELAAVRRRLVATLESAARATYPLLRRRAEMPEAKWPGGPLVSSDNVANAKAWQFYSSHGARVASKAVEVTQGKVKPGSVVMTTRYCLLRELNMCKREGKFNLKEPLALTSGGRKFQLRFCCDRCEMEVLC